MIFTYGKWDAFCKKLKEAGLTSIPAAQVAASEGRYLVLKHDVETNVPKAHRMAAIEHKYGHRGSYYVQAYLMHDKENLRLLSEMQKMGHEISYHYDVMDSQKGDLAAAILEFDKNKMIFETAGFAFTTVCQHGNPVVERVGYTSNRDFFRSETVREKYPSISDIMVNFKTAAQTDYLYYSDAGRKFKLIYDPLTNDIVNSDDKNVPYDDLDALLRVLNEQTENAIISTHPHRWTAHAAAYVLKATLFKCIKTTAKILMKIPFLRKLMGRYYYLAKKI